jgi:hypothetical protein
MRRVSIVGGFIHTQLEEDYRSQLLRRGTR